MSILYTFYGDDFTGSTDVLEQLASNGVETVLFLTPPTPAQLAAFPAVRAIGIAGDSRSRSPEWMSANLPGIFTAMREFNAPVAHYKVCSTFDSSPTHGNIGCAIELGLEAFAPHFVPVVVGAPHLRRYVAFGHLFAAAPDGAIHRIDRHPMARHPVTPMCESDLRRHLQQQAELAVGLVDLTALGSSTAAVQALESQRAAGNCAILFDTTDLANQSVVGKLLWREAQRHALFSASSSGLTAALISAWRTDGAIPSTHPILPIEPASPLLVVSGSCAPATERQIRWALDHGYHGLHLDPEQILAPETIAAATHSLASGRDTIVYTALGTPAASPRGDELGIALGTLVRELLARVPVRRILLCGGDTSSHAVQQLSLTALTWIANLQPGAPLCRAHSADGASTLEVVLKGGQVGTEDFFRLVRGG
jgi:3-oxoisoapionate kinase